MSQYFFFPWVRSGAASFIAAQDNPGETLPNRASINAGVRINKLSGQFDIERKLRLYGPGDVTGLDPRQVIRTDPLHLTTDFEPNYLVSIEFDRPDLPWLFTPASAGDKDRLRPWLCLVVVRKQDGVTLKRYEPGSPLPVLTIASPAVPAEELPDLSESWAWAHAQISAPDDETIRPNQINRILTNNPERNLSRLICPRRLEPRQGYYACVVPAFESGRLAGLGLPVAEEDNLAPAWGTPHADPLKLPVYYSWEFMAGGAGDFESLVWLLERKPPPEGVGQRQVAIPPPADGWPPASSVSLPGALRPIPPTPGQSPEITPTAQEFRDKLSTLLGQGLETSAWNLPPDLPAPPPMYGRWHAARSSFSSGTDQRVWLNTLNLEVRNRIAAGLGAAVVQENQEQLMASAWEQVGEIEKANQLLRQAQLAREAGRQIYQQHLLRLPEAELAAMAGPVLSRVMWEEKGATAYKQVVDSLLPVAALQGAFRRLTRPRGFVARRLGANGAALTGRLVAALVDGSITPTPPHPAPGGMLSDLDWRDRKKQLVPSPDKTGFPAPSALCELTPDKLDNDALIRDTHRDHYERFRRAAIVVQAAMPPCEADLEPRRPPLSLADLKKTLEEELNPDRTVTKRIRARLTLPPGWRPADDLEPIMAAPVFPQAMYREVAEKSQDFLLPGVDRVLPNTITLVETNAEFVEAFMAGLNHEMARELLWRGFPTDQRGSYFRQFWDPSGRVSPPADPENLLDIKRMHQWFGELGSNGTTNQTDGLAVLLIRGDLLRRYPHAMIYAHKADWVGGKRVPRKIDMRPEHPRFPEKYPIFQGALPPDINFVGFSISSDQLVGDGNDAGYFFVLQEQPTEPRFGLDESPPSDPPPDDWDDLSWEAVRTSRGGYIRLSDGLPRWPRAMSAPFSQPQNPPDPVAFRFDNANSAHLAFITMQKPLRVMIHASDLIGAR